MNNLDIRDRKVIVAGSGNLGQTIIENFSHDFNNILVGNRTGIYNGFPAYEVGNLSDKRNIPDTSIGIITATGEGVEKALADFAYRSIPTVLLSTAYKEDLLERYIGTLPILRAPNVAFPIVDLMTIIEEFPDFLGIKMKIQESHQSGKKDPSGTAKKIIKRIKDGGGRFKLDEKNYQSDEGISILGDLISYRGQASKELGVSDTYLNGHAYHTYDVECGSTVLDHIDFLTKIKAWFEQYKNHDFTGLEIGFTEKESGSLRTEFSFYHNVNGRDIYADGLREILPWFLKQQAGIHEVTDYLDR